jgi:hypothetical protein
MSDPATNYGKGWAKGLDLDKIRELDDAKLRHLFATAARDGWVSNNEARTRGDKT